MIGQIFDEHTKKDIQDAQDLGLDAFALNISKNSRALSLSKIANP